MGRPRGFNLTFRPIYLLIFESGGKMITRKWFQISLGLVVLALVSLACSVGGSTSDGSVQSFDEEGMSFVPPKGTIVMNFLLPSVEAKKTDSSPEENTLGPYCSISAFERGDFTVDTMNQWENRTSNITKYYGLTVGDPTQTTLKGEIALVAELSGNFAAEYDSKMTAAYGKQLLASIKGERIFDLFCFGPADRKSETLEIYEALLGSVQFYDPIEPTATP
jgi:hypothetical protein